MVYCLSGLATLARGVIGRLYYVIVILSAHLLMTSFSLRKKVTKNSCSTDNSTRCFMATALNSPTLMSLFTTGGITRFTWGTTFL